MKTPFSEDELKKTGSYGAYSKLNTPITPKENLLRAIRHQDPLWIPLKSDELIFCPRIIPDNVARAWVFEQKPHENNTGGKDMFGIEWVYVPQVGGCMVKPGNPTLTDISEWKTVLHFPDFDSWDWEQSAAENAEYVNTDRYLVTWIFSGLFERLISFMDFENALVALIDEDQQDDLKDLFQALVDMYKDLFSRLKKYFHVDAVFFHDDWGGQKSPFFSVDTFREMIAPYIKQLVDYCHSIDLVFDLHSCGKIEMLIPSIIECGVDKWAGQPLNDKKELIRKYGDKILIGSTDTLHPTPDSAVPPMDELQHIVSDYMDEYGSKLPDNPFFLMNHVPDDDVIAAFYAEGRKRLS
ncbi:MAG: methyltransferase [Lachnospiraceae bacterium]|nr:methyltransferase [Lachnospiraceae bacterium]